VENTLFRVPRLLFAHSEVFRDMFSITQGPDSVEDGTDDEHPLRLDGYQALDFERLMMFLLPQ
jgi:hypothetical protein